VEEDIVEQLIKMDICICGDEIIKDKFTNNKK